MMGWSSKSFALFQNVFSLLMKKEKYDALFLALFPAGWPPISKNCLLTSVKLFCHKDHHDPDPEFFFV